MPSIGLVLLAIVGAETGNVGLAVLFAVLAVAIIGGLLLVLAQERWAVLLGRIAAQVALRFTGVGADQLSLFLIVGTFRTAYPLTVMPLFGFGVLDATLLAASPRRPGSTPSRRSWRRSLSGGPSPCWPPSPSAPW